VVIGAAYDVVAGAATIEYEGMSEEVVASGIKGGTDGKNGSNAGSTTGT